MDSPDLLAKQYTLSHAPGFGERLLPALRPRLPPAPARLLEVGCGRGGVARALAAAGYDVVAVDASPSGIATARAGGGPVRFEVASALQPLRDLAAGVDAVLAMDVIEHLPAPLTFLRHAREALRPGGRIVLSTPYHGYWKNLAISLAGGWDRHWQVLREGGHIKFFSAASLRESLARSGFDGIQFDYHGRLPGLWKTMIVSGERACRD